MSGLEALKRLEMAAYRCCDENARTVEDLDRGISDEDYQAVQTIKKELEALDIIRKHPRIYLSNILCYDTFEEYASRVKMGLVDDFEYLVSKDEFYLLKDALGWIWEKL